MYQRTVRLNEVTFIHVDREIGPFQQTAVLQGDNGSKQSQRQFKTSPWKL